MTPLDAVAIAAAGLAAGTINTIVGSGSLITFPTLLAVGYPPVIANVSNGIGSFQYQAPATLPAPGTTGTITFDNGFPSVTVTD